MNEAIVILKRCYQMCYKINSTTYVRERVVNESIYLLVQRHTYLKVIKLLNNNTTKA